MRNVLCAASLVCALAAWGQDTAKPSITVDELMEKAIAADGGREALSKLTSMIATGTIEIVAMGGTATTELYAKAPDKRVNITTVEGYGVVSQGFDGKVAWSSDPQNGLIELTGNQLAAARRDAVFNGQLKWKELYSKAEITGREKVGERDCWVVKLTPAEGTPVTRWYDAETFLLAKTLSLMESPQGAAEVPIEFSDYRTIEGGIKVPFTVKMTLPNIGDLITRYKEYKLNADIDDAKFSKPKD